MSIALIREEQRIAKKYYFNDTWIYIFWGIGNFLIWLSLWPLAFLSTLPLWLIFIIATLNCCLAYLPSHEAQHGNIVKRGTRFFWVNELVGYLSVLPLLTGYKLLKETHMLHHKYTNVPEKDPDIVTKSSGFFHSLWVCGVKLRQPNAGYGLQSNFYRENISSRAFKEHLIFFWFHWILLAFLCLSGHGLVVIAIWWLPRLIGTAYLQITLSFLPHKPMEKVGRYRDTRGWKASTGTILTQGMEYHIIHHLYPSIPLHKTPSAYRDMRHILEEKNCVLDGGI